MNSSPRSEGRRCLICGKDDSQVQIMDAAMVRPVIVDLIKKTHPEWSNDCLICMDDLDRFRHEWVRSFLHSEKGRISDLDREVLESLEREELISAFVDVELEADLTLGQRLSDKITSFVGSWTFLIVFWCLMVFWVGVNSAVLIFRPFDPYPFIFLNLVLSCLSAIQAPIIMMSQNRQDEKDRARSAHYYQVNLKAELEIRNLHQKIDHLLARQWERLAQIQETQNAMMKELGNSRANKRDGG